MPEASKDHLRDAAIKDLLEGFFDGSEPELLAYLATRPRRQVALAAASSNGAPATEVHEFEEPVAEIETERIDTVLL